MWIQQKSVFLATGTYILSANFKRVISVIFTTKCNFFNDKDIKQRRRMIYIFVKGEMNKSPMKREI